MYPGPEIPALAQHTTQQRPARPTPRHQPAKTDTLAAQDQATRPNNRSISPSPPPSREHVGVPDRRSQRYPSGRRAPKPRPGTPAGRVPGAGDDDAKDQYYRYEDDDPVQAYRELVDQESQDLTLKRCDLFYANAGQGRPLPIRMTVLPQYRKGPSSDGTSLRVFRRLRATNAITAELSWLTEIVETSVAGSRPRSDGQLLSGPANICSYEGRRDEGPLGIVVRARPHGHEALACSGGIIDRLDST